MIVFAMLPISADVKSKKMSLNFWILLPFNFLKLQLLLFKNNGNYSYTFLYELSLHNKLIIHIWE